MAVEYRAFAVTPTMPGYRPDPARPIALRIGGMRRRLSIADAEEIARLLLVAGRNVRSRTVPVNAAGEVRPA